ncbi:hypothetical protein JOC94_001785 [Bacillus thermophilus]|uniref:Uncharacterized protein n=1 Tax=Siminovitchia thermophila TaxID=1245522 RepID=A0ABS2R596_9BACI|nr:hypothetical protein [Siminovitchia thermophila]
MYSGIDSHCGWKKAFRLTKVVRRQTFLSAGDVLHGTFTSPCEINFELQDYTFQHAKQQDRPGEHPTSRSILFICIYKSAVLRSRV